MKNSQFSVLKHLFLGLAICAVLPSCQKKDTPPVARDAQPGAESAADVTKSDFAKADVKASVSDAAKAASAKTDAIRADAAQLDAAKVKALKAALEAQRASDPLDALTFGHYVQEKGQKEPIKWILISEDDADGKQLFISEKILEGKPFNTDPADITWEQSTIRSWLNGYGASQNKAGVDYTGDNFIDKAFTAEEKALLVETSVPAHANPEFSTAPGNETKDRIFLLSIEEVDEHSLEEANLLNAESTDYTRKTGYEGASWWLRSPGKSSDMAARVFSASGVHKKGSNVDKVFGVRPAFWIQYRK